MTDDGAATRNQLANLIDLLEHASRNPAGRAAVHLHLSWLRPHNRRTHHLRIAREVLAEQLQAFSGQIFSLENDDIVFVCKSDDREGIDKAIGRLRTLFGADPLSRDAGGDGTLTFAEWHNFEQDTRTLAQVLQSIDALGGLDQISEGSRKDLRTLEPKTLGEVERALQQADLSSLVRRQWVCAMTPKMPAPEPVLQEYFVAIGDLQECIAPDVDLLSDRYLFQHLTETLDRRMLSMLVRAGEPKGGRRISLNVNVSTLLSQEFLEFDGRLNAAARGVTAFELQVSDVYADIANFMFVRDYLQAKGYRVALDGVTHLTLPFLDRERLGVDLVKIYWSTDLEDYLEGENARWMREFVERAGRGRVILCRVDDENAIEIGNTFGIELFQGRHVDSAVRAAKSMRQMEQKPAAKPATGASAAQAAR